MNHTKIKELIKELYGLLDEWEVSSLKGGITYYYKFKVGDKLYVASVHEQERRENSYIISDEAKFICATMKAKTFEQDLRELAERR